MDAGKSVVVGVGTRNGSGTLVQDHELWLKQGGGYAQEDLEGTWYVYAFSDATSGAQTPLWARYTLLVDATGAVVDGSAVDSDGALKPHTGTLAVDAGGRVVFGGAIAASLMFQDLRMDAGRTVIGGVLSADEGGEPHERLVVAVKSGSARPEILSPVAGSVLPGASVTWRWTDNGALVTEWWLTVGTSLGTADIHSSGSLSAVSREHTVSGLPTAGETLFVRLMYREDGAWLSRDLRYTAATGSAPAPAPSSPSPPPPTSTPDPDASATSSSDDEVSSAPDLSLWGLMAMVFGIWSVPSIRARRQPARRR